MTDTTGEHLREVAGKIVAAGASRPRLARDPVNLPIIENWAEAIGDENPVYTDAASAVAAGHGGLVAPPAMAQVWTMYGLRGARDDSDPTGQMAAALDEAGYTSVVATNCDQEYLRYVRHGERLAVRTALVDLAGPKRTALGEGWFFTTRSTWYSAGDDTGDGEPVATMDFRMLKFRPGSAGPGGAPAPPGPAGEPIRPVASPDTAFFWHGTAAGELRIQRCEDCGALRHPPGPMCTRCGSPRQGHVAAAGTGTVFSYVVHRHPPVPGKRLPLVIALVELDEGVRVLGEMPGAAPGDVRIGMPVVAEFLRVDDQLTLPAWRPAPPAPQEGGLPELVVDVTPTFVISAALATRDFTDVHHDPARAVAKGSKDIFLNILTTTGLVQRLVTDWAGPRALVRSISVRLGAPCYAGDTLRLSGQVTEYARENGADRYVVRVTGRCSLGDHATATVRAEVPAGGAA